MAGKDGGRSPGKSFSEKAGTQVESFYGGLQPCPVHLYVPRIREFSILAFLFLSAAV